MSEELLKDNVAKSIESSNEASQLLLQTVSQSRRSQTLSDPLISNFSSDAGGNGDNDNGSGNAPNPQDYSVKPIPDQVDPSITLASVGGLDEHVRYLKQAVMYPMKNQGALSTWGVDPPKGIMFYGPPGTGKTLLAKALANELSRVLDKNFSFFYHKGGDSFGKYFGQSQQNLQKLFAAADHYKPSIIFFDEIDGLCPDRSQASSTSEAYATVVTALLGLIDSVKRGEVFIIGATNRLNAVDSAIRRPGRFDKQLAFSLPSEEGRRHIIGIHTKDWPHDHPTGDILDEIATRTHGYTGADLEKVCRDTVIAALTRCGDIPQEEVHITRPDWATAIQNMKYSGSNVFGSTLLISEPIPPVLTPLISDTVNEIVQQLNQLITGEIEILSNNLSRNSLFVWDKNPSSEHFTNSIIMKSVLSNRSLGKIPTYILNDETLMTKVDRSTLIGAFNAIIQQVLDSNELCIFYIPRIHILENIMNRCNAMSTFYRQLKRIRGNNIILLATSVTGLADQSNGVSELFVGRNRSYSIPSINTNRRTEFFGQIYLELIANELVPAKKAKADKEIEETEDSDEIFQQQFDRVVELTSGQVADKILTLYDLLNQSKSDWKSGIISLEILADELHVVIDDYAADIQET